MKHLMTHISDMSRERRHQLRRDLVHFIFDRCIEHGIFADVESLDEIEAEIKGAWNDDNLHHACVKARDRSEQPAKRMFGYFCFAMYDMSFLPGSSTMEHDIKNTVQLMTVVGVHPTEAMAMFCGFAEYDIIKP